MRYTTEEQKANIKAFLARHGFYYCYSRKGVERWENSERYTVNIRKA